MATLEERGQAIGEHRLKTGDEYRARLRDGRDVYYLGERIEDVTTHFATAGGIDTIAEIYDEQFDEKAKNILTYVREDGVRVTASYLIPRTKEDLVFRREGIKHVARKSWGTHRLPCADMRLHRGHAPGAP
jgi:4-hydroxyphenylacetate 3-monooxygenase